MNHMDESRWSESMKAVTDREVEGDERQQELPSEVHGCPAGKMYFAVMN